MKNIFFRYKEHPDDLLRVTITTELPNTEDNLEDFLIWFLYDYQKVGRVAYINDLSKLLEDNFMIEEDKSSFIELVGDLTVSEILKEIELIELELKEEAFKNFYHLILNQKIEIIYK